MGTARVWHTATFLRAASACNGWTTQTNSQALASAEIFDPTTGMFTPTKGSMVDARLSHTATLLNDGRVLLTGGVGSSGDSIITAELFDPTTGTFTPTGNMEAARAGQTSTLLKSGQVLVTGGRNNAGSFATAEIFDPTKGSFLLLLAAWGQRAPARQQHCSRWNSSRDGRICWRRCACDSRTVRPKHRNFHSDDGQHGKPAVITPPPCSRTEQCSSWAGAEDLQKFNGKPVPTSLGSGGAL